MTKLFVWDKEVYLLHRKSRLEDDVRKAGVYDGPSPLNHHYRPNVRSMARTEDNNSSLNNWNLSNCLPTDNLYGRNIIGIAQNKYFFDTHTQPIPIIHSIATMWTEKNINARKPTWMLSSRFFHWQKRVYLSLSRNFRNGSPRRWWKISSMYGSNRFTGTSFFIRYFCTCATASFEYSCNFCVVSCDRGKGRRTEAESEITDGFSLPHAPCNHSRSICWCSLALVQMHTQREHDSKSKI